MFHTTENGSTPYCRKRNQYLKKLPVLIAVRKGSILQKTEVLRTAWNGIAPFYMKRNCFVLYEMEVLSTAGNGIAPYCIKKRNCSVVWIGSAPYCRKRNCSVVWIGSAPYCIKRSCSVVWIGSAPYFRKRNCSVMQEMEVLSTARNEIALY